MSLPVFRPTVKRKDMGSVLSCIVSDRLGPGEISRELVQRACHLLGHSGGASLGNSYLALSVALDSLGIAPSEPVTLSALAPSFCLRVIQDKGMVPLVADVDPESGAVDPGDVAAFVAKGARAILVHHTLGIVSDVQALKEHGIPVLEDVSQALGGRIGEAPGGGTGDACLLSLDPEDIITCGGGALVLAKDRQTAAAVKRLVESSPLYSQLADMNAALGISQLAALDRFVAVRREIASAYLQALLKSRHKPLAQKIEADGVLSSFPVVLRDGMKEVRQYAMKKNVETAPAFTGTVVSVDEAAQARCPNARSLMLRCLLFPLYPMLARKDVEAVSKVLATLP